MNIEDGIYQILKNDAGIIEVVAGRIFSGHVPQEITTYPVIMYEAIPPLRTVQTLQGGVTLFRQSIRIFTAARKYGEVSTLDDAIIDLLDEWPHGSSGAVVKPGTSPEESITIQGIFVTEEAHEHEYVNISKLHQFLSVFQCNFLSPLRVS